VGPNSGVGLATQGFAFARALTCFSATEMDFYFPMALANLRSAETTRATDVWHQMRSTDGSFQWAWMVSGGHGMSRRVPPAGAPLGAVVTFEASDDAFRKFAAIVDKLERGDIDHVVHLPKPGQLQMMKNALCAREPLWPTHLAHRVLEPLRATLRPGNGFGLGAARQHWQTVSLPQLGELRRQFGMDAVTTAGLAWSILLTDRAIQRQDELGISDQQMVQVCWPLLFGQEWQPWELLKLTCSRLVDGGLQSIQVEVAEECRDDGAAAIERALASPDMDTHLAELHGALLQTFVAYSLYDFLAGTSAPGEATRYRKVSVALDERLVRLQYPFMNQLLDLNTDVVWSRHRRLVQLAREEGEEALSSVLSDLTKSNLFYPRAVAELLLTDTEDRAAADGPVGS
jgi:hypothetical protein